VSGKRGGKSSAVRYSKRIVLMCLVVMTAIFIIDAVLCWRAGEQLDSSSVAAMSGFWGAEVFSAAWIKVTEEKQKSKAAQQSAREVRRLEEEEQQPEP
jgi:putative Ca2+/H+ antiporter (TMEM165/GDT1 family)